MSFFDRFKKKDERQVENLPISANEIIVSPITGEVRDIKECEDQVFAQELVGKGLLIIPSEGKLYSPVDGEIAMPADTKHAVGFTSNTGVEVLVHVGLDTVELEGAPYKAYASQGDKVNKGDLILDFDISAIEAAGKSSQTPLLITNHEGKELNILKNGSVSHGEDILEVIG